MEYLQGQIDPNWRPDEFDYERLLFRPDPRNPDTILHVCSRSNCGVLLNRSSLCPSCQSSWNKVKESGVQLENWLKVPRQRREVSTDCLVHECMRGQTKYGLCASHAASYARNRLESAEDTYSLQDWIAHRSPRPLPALPKCRSGHCSKDRLSTEGLCDHHNRQYKTWRKAQGLTSTTEATEAWLERGVEPAMDPEALSSYASAAATPFGLLPEPLRWEFLYAVQQRDLGARAGLHPMLVRSTYGNLRQAGLTTAVGLDRLGRPKCYTDLSAMLTEWQRLIDDAHRAWSGEDRRDSRLIYLRDLELRETQRSVGPAARMDLRPIQQDWIFDAVAAWARHTARGPAQLNSVANAWTLVSQVLTARGTPKRALGIADMNAVVSAVRARWTGQKNQARHIKEIDTVIQFARTHEDLAEDWGEVPPRFTIDASLHSAIGTKDRSAANADEPFRFVPQPIVDWVMDHLGLIDRGSVYLTAEARALIFIQERCGRRSGETLRLKDDCISYDDQGAPYLEWTQGKPPRGPGKRLPLHQETHDVIRQWQEIKRDHGVESEWLFPSQGHRKTDVHYSDGYLATRLHHLIGLVVYHAPFQGAVEGPEGNLVHFDLATIDPYSFRHAFAQRLADATDEEGRSTTPPDVLQELMGHKSFNSTMAYYQVTANRRKRALAAIPSRRLNLQGQVVEVSREREAFGKTPVSLGHCSEPQNVAANGHFCSLEHSCESCPFFLVDPLEKGGMINKRQQIRIKLERARAIRSPQHILDHYTARIDDCSTIIDGIDAYIDSLEEKERIEMRSVLEAMAEIRRRATAPRTVHLRDMLRGGPNGN